MDLGKVKEALQRAGNELDPLVNAIEKYEDYEGGEPHLGTARNLSEIKMISFMARLALAELDKPADDDAMSAWKSLLDHFAKNNWRLNEDVCLSIFQQYAESYHAKKCAECKKDGAWISVEDRLPKEFDNVLVLDDSGDVYKASWTDFGNGIYWFDFSDEEHAENITHWHPLPEAPRA